MKCKKIKVSNIFTNLILLLCVITIFIALYLIAKDYIENKKSKDSNQELIHEVVNEDPIGIDWEKLKDINPDIVAWLVVENTNINYPILKTEDDLYYLTHTYERQYNRNGSIIITTENIDFEDNEINIYGHNMRNGNMFSVLKNYMDKEFFNSHQKLYIYTPTCNYEGLIFSTYSANVFKEENILNELEFVDKIDYYKNKSVHSCFLESENVDKIVKLITCSYLNSTTNPTQERYYIIATLKKLK